MTEPVAAAGNEPVKTHFIGPVAPTLGALLEALLGVAQAVIPLGKLLGQAAETKTV